MTDYAAARANMIESQVRPNGITDRRIIAAMENVAREDFVPETRKAVAYMDEDIALTANDSAGGERYLIEAMAFARMLQQVAVKPGDRVLVVGTATGYSAAVLAALAAEIVAVESDIRLIREARVNLREFANVKIVEGALEDGSKADGPFDVIVLEGRVDEVSAALLAQLADGGRLIAYARAAIHSLATTNSRLIINDRVDIALATSAAGVHLGQEDMTYADARRIAGPDLLIGISTHSIEQAVAAEEAGADYIGCGPTFPSSTKSFDAFPGTPFLSQVAKQISVPAFAIGGIDASNLDQALQAGCTRVALSSAIHRSDNPIETLQSIKRRLGQSGLD